MYIKTSLVFMVIPHLVNRWLCIKMDASKLSKKVRQNPPHCLQVVVISMGHKLLPLMVSGWPWAKLKSTPLKDDLCLLFFSD